MSTIYISIDPGNHNGIAIYNSGTKQLELYTESFWETINCLIKMKKYCAQVSHELIVYIECPFLNKGRYGKKFSDSKSEAMTGHIAESVGRNKQTAQLLVDFMKSRNIQHSEIRPTKKKKNTEEFAEIVGYKQKCNQHERDAAMILINQNATHFNGSK